MKKNRLLFICCVLPLLPSIALAGSMGTEQTSPWSKIATLSFGPAYTNVGSSQTIYLQPDIVKNYQTSDNTDALISGELFLGAQHAINDLLLGQLGLAIAASSPAQLNGLILEDADIDFNNYNYNYYIQHDHIALKGKLLSKTDLLVSPYLSGSIGVGFNQSYDFTITPLISQEIPAPPFKSNTTVAFTYTLGAGFQRALNEHWQVGLGYEFADWGQSGLNRASGQTQNSGLQLSHVYTQQLQLGLTYLAGG